MAPASAEPHVWLAPSRQRILCFTGSGPVTIWRSTLRYESGCSYPKPVEPGCLPLPLAGVGAGRSGLERCQYGGADPDVAVGDPFVDRRLLLPSANQPCRTGHALADGAARFCDCTAVAAACPAVDGHADLHFLHAAGAGFHAETTARSLYDVAGVSWFDALQRQLCPGPNVQLAYSFLGTGKRAGDDAAEYRLYPRRYARTGPHQQHIGCGACCAGDSAARLAVVLVAAAP